jgi:hypothetical protein
MIFCVLCTIVVTKIKQLNATVSPRSDGLSPTWIHVKFVVGELALEQWFLCQQSFRHCPIPIYDHTLKCAISLIRQHIVGCTTVSEQRLGTHFPAKTNKHVSNIQDFAKQPPVTTAVVAEATNNGAWSAVLSLDWQEALHILYMHTYIYTYIHISIHV